MVISQANSLILKCAGIPNQIINLYHKDAFLHILIIQIYSLYLFLVRTMF